MNNHQLENLFNKETDVPAYSSSPSQRNTLNQAMSLEIIDLNMVEFILAWYIDIVLIFSGG